MIDKRPMAVRTKGLASAVPDVLTDWFHHLPRATARRPPEGYRLTDVTSRGVGWAEPDPDPLATPDPNRHRTGTCFEVESTEMRAAAVPALEAMLGGEHALHEVRHQHNGYHTDLVVCDVDAEGLAAREALTVGREPLHDPLQRFKTWWYCREHGPLNRHDAIENGLYTDASKNRKHVDWLLDHGYLARTSTGAVVGIELPRIADLHAVELKLRDWEQALEQAARANRCYHNRDERRHYGTENLSMGWRHRYGYADYRWVALDAGGVRPALKHRDVFEDAGVGLLAIAEGGTVIKHVGAEHAPREPYTRDRAYAESALWAALELDDWLGGTNTDAAAPTAQPGLATFADGGDTA